MKLRPAEEVACEIVRVTACVDLGRDERAYAGKIIEAARRAVWKAAAEVVLSQDNGARTEAEHALVRRLAAALERMAEEGRIE